MNLKTAVPYLRTKRPVCRHELRVAQACQKARSRDFRAVRRKARQLFPGIDDIEILQTDGGTVLKQQDKGRAVPGKEGSIGGKLEDKAAVPCAGNGLDCRGMRLEEASFGHGKLRNGRGQIRSTRGGQRAFLVQGQGVVPAGPGTGREPAGFMTILASVQGHPGRQPGSQSVRPFLWKRQGSSGLRTGTAPGHCSPFLISTDRCRALPGRAVPDWS